MEKIKMNEASGDDTVIEFNNQNINQPLPGHVFEP